MRVSAIRHRSRSRGVVAVEVALGLGILLALSWLASDVHRIAIERARVENTAGTTALSVAGQYRLTRAGFDALTAATLKDHEDEQDLVVMQVAATGEVAWGLRRGAGGSLCNPDTAAGRYAGPLPERRSADDSTDAVSFVVVLSCRSTRGIALFGGLVLPDILHSRAVYRLLTETVKLDETLQAESDATGLALKKEST